MRDRCWLPERLSGGSDERSDAFCLVTGASTGIGRELANRCAVHHFDLLVAADEPEIENAAEELRGFGVHVDTVQADLATIDGVDRLIAAIGGRQVDALLANAGRGLGDTFLNQDIEDIRHVLDTNITGTLYLIHQVGNEMRRHGSGRILITGSVAGFIPGSFHAIYNASKAFLDSFAAAMGNELKGTGVTVTCLMPGAIETEFFRRAGLMDTKLGTAKKDDPAEVAKQGFDAMMNGESSIITGLTNKLQVAAASLLPSSTTAEQHRKKAAPGTAKHP